MLTLIGSVYLQGLHDAVDTLKLRQAHLTSLQIAVMHLQSNFTELSLL